MSPTNRPPPPPPGPPPPPRPRRARPGAGPPRSRRARTRGAGHGRLALWSTPRLVFPGEGDDAAQRHDVGTALAQPVEQLSLERLGAPVHLLELLAKLEEQADAGQADAITPRELEDHPHAFDVALGVPARVAGGAPGREQSAPLVHAEGLRVHARELGGNAEI